MRRETIETLKKLLGQRLIAQVGGVRVLGQVKEVTDDFLKLVEVSPYKPWPGDTLDQKTKIVFLEKLEMIVVDESKHGDTKRNYVEPPMGGDEPFEAKDDE